MFTEQYKDQVYFADCLAKEKESRNIYKEIVAILDANGVKHGLLRGTEDYWCRDYMPIQDGYDSFTQFVYHPDYLEKEREYETPRKVVVDNTHRIRKNVCLQQEDIIADGGNFTACTSKHGNDVIVMTEKIFAENPTMTKEAILKEIGDRIFNREIVLLPWDKEDECGHTDGIVHNIGDGRVLVNLEVYPKEIAAEMRKRLEEYFDVVDLKLSNYHDDSWAYINMLQTRDVIIVPALGMETDAEALAQIKELHPDYEDRIYQVNVAKLVKDYGGALNCLSWTISTDSSKMRRSPEREARYKELVKKGKKDEDSLTQEELDFLIEYNAPRLEIDAPLVADRAWEW